MMGVDPAKSKPTLMRRQPRRVKVAPASVYVSLEELMDAFGIAEKHVRSLLSVLGVPLVHFPGGDARYALLYALDTSLFNLGLPKIIKESPDLARVHHELAGVLYGTLTKEMIRERVLALGKVLTSHAKDGKMGRRKRRVSVDSAKRRFGGRR